MSVRTIVVFLLAVAVGPSLLVQGGIYAYWFTSAYESNLQANKELAHALAAALEGYVLDLAQHEQVIGAAISTKWPYTTEELDALMAASAKDYPALNAFLLFGPDGRVIAGSDARLKEALKPVDVSDREYFREAIRAHGWALSDLLEGRADPNPIFVVARAIYRGDKLEGVLVGSVNPDRLAEATIKLQRREGGGYACFDRKGHLVFRSSVTSLTWADRIDPDSGDLVQRALRGEEATGTMHWKNSTEQRLAVRVPVGRLGWVAGTGEPRSHAVAPAARTLLLAGGGNLGVICLSLGGAWFISRRIVRGINGLRSHAQAVGQGNLDQTVPLGRIREVGDLAEAFNRMTTLRRSAEQALLAAKEEWERTFDSVPDLIAIMDSNHRVMRANRAMAQRLGRRPEECIGLPCFEVVHGTGCPQDSCPHAQTIIDGKEHTVELHEPGLGGDFLVTTTPLLDGSGKLIGSVHVARDITDRKRAEGELKSTALELARSNQDLEQFAYVASHDLQEPLRMVTGHLSIIQDRLGGSLDETTSQSMFFAMDGAGRMQAMISDLLTFCRAGRKADGFLPTDMEAVLAVVLDNLAAAIADAGAVVEHDPLPTVKAEQSQMIQLLQNLIGNAIKYQPAGQAARIQVAAARDHDGWLLSVRDNGIGIRPEHLDRVFMIFQRLHSRDQYPGTGIGLALCKRIVEFHGGRIWVESEPGKGSTFLFTLPDR
jgi:PAS domain S-box-containing protein